jgi:SAM-dependent methyltransferase
MERDDPAYEGQREYTPLFLRIYDPLIFGLFTPVVWRCPSTRLVEGYRRHLGQRHLDVGPGTGYFLERAGLADSSPVTLLDPNVHVLEHASRRLQRLDVTTVEADVCKPLPVHGPFDSAARVELETVGSMAIFSATNPRPKPSSGMTPLTSRATRHWRMSTFVDAGADAESVTGVRPHRAFARGYAANRRALVCTLRQ